MNVDIGVQKALIISLILTIAHPVLALNDDGAPVCNDYAGEILSMKRFIYGS